MVLVGLVTIGQMTAETDVEEGLAQVLDFDDCGATLNHGERPFSRERLPPHLREDYG